MAGRSTIVVAAAIVVAAGAVSSPAVSLAAEKHGRAQRAATATEELFWKDPFSDDPERLIPVRQIDRDLEAARHEAARARAAARAAQLQITSARAEIARAEAALAHANAFLAAHHADGGGRAARRSDQAPRAPKAAPPAREPVAAPVAAAAPPTPAQAAGLRGIVVVPMDPLPPPAARLDRAVRAAGQHRSSTKVAARSRARW
jgi:hypothetical protein